MLYHVPHFINGEKLDSTGRQLDIYRPDKGEVAGYLHVANAATVDMAVMAAKKAFPIWSQQTPDQRAQCLFKYKMLLEAHTHNLADLVTKEHGKTLEEAVGSVKRGIEVVAYATGIPQLLQSSYSAHIAHSIDGYVLQQPLGVCVGITPFNFPAMIPLWMFSMAIACGNTFVLKPSEKDPSVSLLLLELLHEAGVPDGVVNIVQGDSETVDHLIQHPQVKAVSFVGSSAVASQVYQKAIHANKRAQAFGGAKNHCVVMPDADMQRAADAIISAAYGSAGERCMAISVVVAVTDAVADHLIAEMMPKIKKLTVGRGESPATDVGPLVTEAHWKRVNGYIELGKKEGALLVIDGQLKLTQGEGYYMAPCLFDRVTPNMRLYQEEIFGPVLVVVRAQTLQAAIQLINAHPYGNGCAIFTNDGYAARTFVQHIEVGMVGINVAVPIPAAYMGFGGWKQSVFADLGMYGEDAIRFYTLRKKVLERWFERS